MVRRYVAYTRSECLAVALLRGNMAAAASESFESDLQGSEMELKNFLMNITSNRLGYTICAKNLSKIFQKNLSKNLSKKSVKKSVRNSA